MSSEVIQNRLPTAPTAPTARRVRVPLNDITNTISYVEPAAVLHNIVFVPTRTSLVVETITSYVNTISPEEMEKIRMIKRKQLKKQLKRL
jgi:hypothetical protein